MAVVKDLMYVIGGNIYQENDDSEHKPVCTLLAIYKIPKLNYVFVRCAIRL